MIGNAHLDPAWMWEWGEGMEAFIATCRSALDRMKETPDLIFTCSSAAHYAWIERSEPEMFREIQQRVAEGRWELAGGWWVQADCNIPSGEGLMRQGEIGGRWFQEKFGEKPTVGYSPDAFGHSAGLPQILRRSGLSSYIFCRPDPTEMELPSPLFLWKSTDDSSVLAYRVPFHYNMYQTTVRKKVEDLYRIWSEDERLAGSDEWALFYGVGNHGGGPTKEQIKTIEEIRGEGRVDLQFGRLDTFLKNAERTSFPTVTGELQMNSPGTYSVHSGMKRLNRRGEEELCRAEILDAVATLLDGDGAESYRSRNEEAPGSLEGAWREVCFNHFHDLLCGVAIKPALENAMARYGHALFVADEAAQFALRDIVRSVDTTGPGQTLFLFNPHGFEIDEPIDFEIWHDIDKERWGEEIDIRVADLDGNDLPVDRIETVGKIGDDRVAARFRGAIPPLGWRCWRVYYGEKGAYETIEHPVDASSTFLQNQHLRVEFPSLTDQKSPPLDGITRLYDRRHGLEFLNGRGAYVVRMKDETDTWGHGVERFDREEPPLQLEDIQVVASGETGATVRTVAVGEKLKVTQWYTLHHDASYLDVRCRVENGGQGALKLLFDTSLSEPQSIAEALYDTIVSKADGRERPGGAWKGVVGVLGEKSVTLGVADTLTHGYSCSEGQLGLTILRSVPYATHEPHPFSPAEDRDLIDIGTVEFCYRVRPIVEGQPVPLLHRDALTLNRPPLRSLESPHPAVGKVLPPESTGVVIDHQAIVLTVMRREEDGATTLRFFESSGDGAEGRVEIALLGYVENLVLGPHEVRTVTIPPPVSYRREAYTS